MKFMDLVDVLFRQGLGELPVFYSGLNGLYLGNMVYERGKLRFKDKGILPGDKQAMEQPDWDKHIVGVVCYRKLLQWESLSFYGLDYCELQSEADPDFVDSLKEMKNQYGDRLFDFIGSIYRAYHLMLDHDLVPVVLLRTINSRGNVPGLAIADLRSTSIGANVGNEIGHQIRRAVDKQLTLDVEAITQENTS